MTKDPLAKLFVGCEYTRGYKNGRAFGRTEDKRIIERRLLTTEKNRNKYVIFCGNVMLLNRFNSSKGASDYIKELLGDKIKLKDSTYVVRSTL